MSYMLEPLVAGELGAGTEMDTSTHPPQVRRLEYVLDLPIDEDLIQSFPVFLVSDVLASALAAANLSGFEFDDAIVRKSDQYGKFAGDLPHKKYRWLRLIPATQPDCWTDDHYRLCVSDRMYEVISQHSVEHCGVEETS